MYESHNENHPPLFIGWEVRRGDVEISHCIYSMHRYCPDQMSLTLYNYGGIYKNDVEFVLLVPRIDLLPLLPQYHMVNRMGRQGVLN